MITPLERFINYAKIDTQSDSTTHTTPSTEKQKNLGRLLVLELKDLGLDDAQMDEYGNIYAHLKGEGDKIGFNAHMDTALEVSGKNVHPQVHKNYDGKDIILNKEYTLSPNDFPHLKNHIGQTLVTTDGTTLLGADDKAGIAIIMSALQYLKDHPEIKHHSLSISFTIDEEIGEGPNHFNYELMDAEYAYSFDGGEPNGVGDENFNAYKVTLNVKGVSVHPGEGKNNLINAYYLISQVINSLPQNETPFHSENDQPFWHITNVSGTSEKATLELILRGFNLEDIKRYQKILESKIMLLQNEYKKATLELSIEEQYLNMKEYTSKKPKVVQKAFKAIKANGLDPYSVKTRGGTDGAIFSRKGLITPNLGTGSYNHHGRYEYLILEEFESLVSVCIYLMTK